MLKSNTNRRARSSDKNNMPDHNFHPKYRPDIDGLRALAILPVVGYHAFPSVVPGGFVGVDIFFVISGFLISLIVFKSLAHGDFTFSDFYARRAKRLLPALLLVTGTCYAVGWFVLLPNEFKQLGKHIAAGLGFVQNIVLWKEAGYFDVASELKPLLHLWSLAVEEQFYLVYPFLVWLAWKARIDLLISIMVLCILSFALSQNGVHTDAAQAFFAPHTRFWELMVGSILAYSQSFGNWRTRLATWRHKGPAAKQWDAQVSSILSIIGLLLVVFSVVAYKAGMPYPGVRALVPVAGATLLIMAGADAWVNRNLLSHKAMVWVGLISYPLYLWHWPLLSFARVIGSETPSPGVRLAAVAGSVALAALTYYFIEKRMRSDGSTWRTVAVLWALAALIAGIGYHAYCRDGVASRFPKIVGELSAYHYDHRAAYRADICFLSPEQDFSGFALCKSETLHEKAIFLWGDSHAAHLYPGLRRRYSHEYTIIQRTASGCPPILGVDIKNRAHCKKINDQVLQALRDAPPEHIFLAAIWTNYDRSKLAATIKQLQDIGIKDIRIVGPVPQWKDSLSKQLYLYYQGHVPHTVPERMDFGLQQNFFGLDDVLKVKLQKEGVHYISARDILCNKDGCITRLGATGDTLTAWDNSHLTARSSEFLVSRFPSF
jgi:peptidoglycan/LPS O-acetylase OafA/YrhL